MLRLIVPLVMLVLGLGAGIGAGLMLRPGDIAGVDARDAGDDSTTEAGTDAAATGGSTEYVRLNNQFVVPIVHRGSVRSLIVMSLTVEVDSGQAQMVFQQEPRLRDAFLRVMFAHANAGGFDGSFTDAAAMAPLRMALSEAAGRIIGPEAHDVLIVDITRQDA